jgi:hypothetical protein
LHTSVETHKAAQFLPEREKISNLRFFPVENHRSFPFLLLDMKMKNSSATLAAGAAATEERRRQQI